MSKTLFLNYLLPYILTILLLNSHNTLQRYKIIILYSHFSEYNFNILLVGLLVTAIISSLTIGGKAIGKSFAINKSDIILYEFAKFISNFYKG